MNASFVGAFEIFRVSHCASSPGGESRKATLQKLTDFVGTAAGNGVSGLNGSFSKLQGPFVVRVLYYVWDL